VRRHLQYEGLQKLHERYFTTYLVGADGKLVARWPTKVKPEDPRIVAAIESALPS
jgi:glutathione peroxidase-family protein